MLLATAHAMSHGAQAVVYFIALVAFIVAAALAWFTSKALWAALVGIGLALCTLVLFWNAVAAA